MSRDRGIPKVEGHVTTALHSRVLLFSFNLLAQNIRKYLETVNHLFKYFYQILSLFFLVCENFNLVTRRERKG